MAAGGHLPARQVSLVQGGGADVAIHGGLHPHDVVRDHGRVVHRRRGRADEGEQGVAVEGDEHDSQDGDVRHCHDEHDQDAQEAQGPQVSVPPRHDDVPHERSGDDGDPHQRRGDGEASVVQRRLPHQHEQVSRAGHTEPGKVPRGPSKSHAQQEGEDFSHAHQHDELWEGVVGGARDGSTHRQRYTSLASPCTHHVRQLRASAGPVLLCHDIQNLWGRRRCQRAGWPGKSLQRRALPQRRGCAGFRTLNAVESHGDRFMRRAFKLEVCMVVVWLLPRASGGRRSMRHCRSLGLRQKRFLRSCLQPRMARRCCCGEGRNTQVVWECLRSVALILQPTRLF